jgi:hypothetical protein
MWCVCVWFRTGLIIPSTLSMVSRGILSSNLRVRSTTQETQQADKKEKLAPHGVEAARTKQQQLLPACSRTELAGTNNDSAYMWMREWVSEWVSVGVSEWVSEWVSDPEWWALPSQRQQIMSLLWMY